MSVATAGSVSKPSGWSWLWRRQLDTYPDTAPRLMYLGITVLATVMLYYELYVGGSVSTLFLVKLHMSFSFLVYTLAFGALIGAFGSLFAGLTDRFGRCNLVVYGLLITGLFTFLVIPAMTNKWGFTVAGFFVGFVEGICLVATPALIRDFSPQVGRATAMGFWTSGPVIGSLVVFLVASHTIGSHPSPSFWVHEYKIAGVVGLVVFAIALVGLKELSPGLRDQLMVTTKDRVLIEARAKGLDIESALRNPFRQLLKADVILSSVGISIFLLIYYTAVGFALIYFTTVFGFSVNQGDALGNWNWGFNVIAVILIGFVSDRFRVRKPFMIVGGIAAAVMLVLYLQRAGHPTGYYHVATLLAALAFALGVAYVPWMASFTETVEARNPALTATGLAIWGWIIRIIVFVSYLILPSVINTVTPLVTYGATVQAAAAKYGSEVAFATQYPEVVAAATKYQSELAFAQTHPQVVATAQRLAPELAAIQAHLPLFLSLQANPTNKALQGQLAAAVGPQMVANIAANQAALASVFPYATQLKALAAIPPATLASIEQHATQLTALAAAANDPNFQTLVKHGTQVANAAKKTASQWRTWYWICFGCMIFFLFTVPLMRGRWRPKDAKADEEAHEAMVQEEMAKLGLTTTAS